MLPLIAALPREDPWQREVRWLEERLALACGYDQSHLTRESDNALVVRLENYVLLTAENAAAAVHRGLRGPGYPGSPRWCRCSGGIRRSRMALEATPSQIARASEVCRIVRFLHAPRLASESPGAGW